MKYKIRRRRKTIKTSYIFILFSIILILISISYAKLSKTLRINGTATGEWEELDIVYLHIDNSSLYPSTIKYMQTFTYTFDNPPIIDNISMGGNQISSPDGYTYTNGVLTIPDVTGNLVINGEPLELEDFSIKYVYGDEIQFDGTTVLDTDMALLSNENFGRDFEINLHLDNFVYDSTQNGGWNTLLNCANHDTSPYHGFLIRRNSKNNVLKCTQANNTVGETTLPAGILEDVVLYRKNNYVYYNINNNNEDTQLGFMGNNPERTDYNLLFGADIISANNTFRYLKGQLSNVSLECYYEAEEAPIILPHPKLTGYSFGGWYLDANFTQKIGNAGFEYTPRGDTILYAKWNSASVADDEDETDRYVYNGQYNFAQNDYINTHVYLYTQNNIHRNFELSFDIDSLGNSSNGDVLMEASKNTVDIAKIANGLLNIKTVGGAADGQIKNIPNTITNIKLIRINDILYYSLNNQTPLKINNYTNVNTYSTIPVIFGASVDSNMNGQKLFDGILSNMSVKFISDEATIQDYMPQHGNLSVAFNHEGNYVFDGTNNIDTNIKLFDYSTYDKDFEISFNIVELANNNEKQATLVNSKYENQQAGYPGFCYRIDSTNTNLELTAAKATSGTAHSDVKSAVQSVKIARRNMKMYITINGGTEEESYDFTGFKDFFNTNLTIGSSTNTSGIYRGFRGTLSDIVVKIEE